MSTFLIAIDPGNNTGITSGYITGDRVTKCYDFTPAAAKKGKGKNKVGAAPKEKEHLRYGKLWNTLLAIAPVEKRDHGDKIVIICEGAFGFQKGKSAVEVSNQFRGVIKAFAAAYMCEFVGIQPNDLQRFATGKGKAEKSEMIEIARSRYGYNGWNDNEADSVLLWEFQYSQIMRDIKPHKNELRQNPVTPKEAYKKFDADAQNELFNEMDYERSSETPIREGEV